MSPGAGYKPARTAIALVMVAALIMLTPMLWVLILSFKDNTALMADTGSAFLPPWTLANYASILGDGQVFTWLMNSMMFARHDGRVLLLSSLAGYGFARLDFPGRRLLFVVVLFGLAIPEQAVIIGRHRCSAQCRGTTPTPTVAPGLSCPSVSSS